jgi:hypothetical protein
LGGRARHGLLVLDVVGLSSSSSPSSASTRLPLLTHAASGVYSSLGAVARGGSRGHCVWGCSCFCLCACACVFWLCVFVCPLCGLCVFPFLGVFFGFGFCCVFLCGFLCFNGFPFAVLKEKSWWQCPRDSHKRCCGRRPSRLWPHDPRPSGPRRWRAAAMPDARADEPVRSPRCCLPCSASAAPYSGAPHRLPRADDPARWRGGPDLALRHGN